MSLRALKNQGTEVIIDEKHWKTILRSDFVEDFVH